MIKKKRKEAQENKKDFQGREKRSFSSEEKDKGIVESFLGSMPVLGDFFKELGKTEAFQERFKEVDEQIRENLKKGEKKQWGFKADISVRPIIDEVKKETSEFSLHEDYFYGKNNKKLTLAVKVPQEDVNCKIEGKNLLITTENFKKKIEMPDNYRGIKKKQYKKGILILELTK